MGIFLLCSEKGEEASVAQPVKEWESGAGGHQMATGQVVGGLQHQCKKVGLYPNLMGKNYKVSFFTYKRIILPWLVWLSRLSTGLQKQRVTALIPSQGTCLGCRPGPQ